MAQDVELHALTALMQTNFAFWGRTNALAFTTNASTLFLFHRFVAPMPPDLKTILHTNKAAWEVYGVL